MPTHPWRDTLPTADPFPALTCDADGWGPDAVWVHAAGELDLATSEQLARTLASALAQERARLIVLDLREISFMDSAGLHAIARAEASARGAGRRLALVRGPAQVQRLLTLTSAELRLEIFELEPGQQPDSMDTLGGPQR